ncbi:MAG: multiprotein-bridging factor 1 family protein, partial [Candidatus Cryptobacteroides sp.]
MSAIIIIDGRSTEATGSIIRKYRRMRGLTQEELGKQLKVRKSRISKIENNENLDTDTLMLQDFVLREAQFGVRL